MAPYRPNGQSRRSGARGYVDHDIFEGLPVRHWRRTTVQVGVPPKPESSSRLLQPELPLPKEANLLSPMSRALLQAARAGTINKTLPVEEEAVVKEGDDEEDEEERGFIAGRWSAVPRHLERPEREYLAKKRKGLELKAPNGGAGAGAGVMKKAKIRRTDTEGNAYVEEIVMTEGQKVEGEVIAEVPMADPVVSGRVVEGVGVVNSDGVVVSTETAQPTPPRRRPPPPRRKPRGPGRGRKKKVQFVPGAEGVEGTDARGIAPIAANGSLIENGQPPEGNALPRARIEGGFRNDDGDTEMIDDSNLRDGDEEEDDNDDGEEGDEGDDDDREEGELTPSPTPEDVTTSVSTDPLNHPKPSAALPQPTLPNFVHPLPPRPDVQVPAANPVQRSASSSPDLPLAQRSDPPAKNEEGGAPDFIPTGGDVAALIENRISTPAQEGMTQDELTPEDLVLVDLLQEDPPPTDPLPEDPLPEDPPQENPPKEDPPREDLLQVVQPQEDLPQENPPQKDPLHEGPPQEDQVLKDPAPLPQGEEPDETGKEAIPPVDVPALPADTAATVTATETIEASEEVHFPDGDIDLFGSLEKHLAEHSSILAAVENSPKVENLNDTVGKEETGE
ncbi:hypothetical protein FGG08_001938 [Glutinoglossum americanum]|uniref:Lyr family protein n=1 Tax=Glutinoglossum americanum TaxID=1670608 RepID=A0A9P8I787_9PEZI|nr:hypothetical protein FGG08_001938 [Glutinoglossum americanum]